MQAVTETGEYSPVLERSLQETDIDIKESYVAQLFRKWGEVDVPLAAMAGISDATVEDDALKGFLSGWLEWMDGARLRTCGRIGEMTPWGAHLVAVGRVWAKSGTADGERSNSIRSSMSRWARTDMEAAEYHCHGMNDSRDKSSASVGIVLAKMEKGQDISGMFESIAAIGSALMSVSSVVKKYKSSFQENQVDYLAENVAQLEGLSSKVKKRILTDLGALEHFSVAEETK